jgi:hypothetical protein
MFRHDLLVAPAPRGYFPRSRDHLRLTGGSFRSLGQTRTPHHQEVPLLLARTRQIIRANASLHEERTHEKGTLEPSRTTPKLSNCFQFYMHNSVEDLLQFIPRDCLPSDYGGTSDSASVLHGTTQQHLKPN